MQEPVHTCLTRREFWIQRMERFAQSGLTVKEFCAQEKTSVPSFYQWKKKLAPTEGKENPIAAFVPIQLDPSHARLAGSILHVTLPGGAMVSVPASLSADAMSDVFVAIIRASK